MTPIQFHANLGNRTRMTRNAYNETRPKKLIRPTNTTITNALAYNTSTPRAREHGHAVCMIKSDRVRGKHQSSLDPARTSRQPA